MMFKVRNIFTGEVFTVYDVNPGGSFLFYRPAEPDTFPVWIWDDMDKYEPMEDG